MKDESVLVHCEYESARSFDEAVAALEKAVNFVSNDTLREIVLGSANEADFETRIRAVEGPSGFIRFLDVDHGAWMTRIGLKARARLYVLGNPLIARTMLQHDLGVGLNVPVRVMIYEDQKTGTTRLAYDLPSSLMARLGNEKVTAAAERLDEKLAELARTVTGAGT
jgi:uncharacterized protein (DUF302 family)